MAAETKPKEGRAVKKLITDLGAGAAAAAVAAALLVMKRNF